MSKKILDLRQFSTPIIVDGFINIFYKATRNVQLTFNREIAKCFDLFCPEILAFLFGIIHCNISKYKSGNKVVRSFDGKIATSWYYYT